jgi:hypothetical protein
MRRSKLFLLIPCVLALAAGCATPEPAETTSPPARTVPPTTTTTEPPVALVPAASFEHAAAELLRAWRAGDRAAAGKIAQPQAVEVLFGNEPGPTQSRGCALAQLDHDCAYRYGDRLLRLKVVQHGGGWIVEQAEVD